MPAESRQQAARKLPESRGRTDGEQSRDTSHMTRRAASMPAESRQQAARKLPESRGRTDGEQSRDTSHMTRRAASKLSSHVT